MNQFKIKWKLEYSEYRRIIKNAWETCPDICGSDDYHMERAESFQKQYLDNHPNLQYTVNCIDGGSDNFNYTGYTPILESTPQWKHYDNLIGGNKGYLWHTYFGKIVDHS